MYGAAVTQAELPREKLTAMNKELAQLEPAVRDWQHLERTQTVRGAPTCEESTLPVVKRGTEVGSEGSVQR
jgi:hypothetical protein